MVLKERAGDIVGDRTGNVTNERTQRNTKIKSLHVGICNFKRKRTVLNYTVNFREN